MRWTVGLDLVGHDHGAVRFAQWVVCATGSRDRARALHELNRPQLDRALDRSRFERVESLAWRLAKQTIDASAPNHVFDAIDLRLAEHPEAELVAQSNPALTSALVIGRRARMEGAAVVRLGKVARRLLRRLPCPVVVAPPDWRAEAGPEAPVLLATDLREDSDGAARFAAVVAARLERPLLPVYVEPLSVALSGHYVPIAVYDHLTRRRQGVVAREAERWLQRNGIDNEDYVVTFGEPVDRLMDTAQERSAALIVAGSRRLTGMGRLFSASVGAGLAAHARHPVAIVPPDWQFTEEERVAS